MLQPLVGVKLKKKLGIIVGLSALWALVPILTVFISGWVRLHIPLMFAEWPIDIAGGMISARVLLAAVKACGYRLGTHEDREQHIELRAALRQIVFVALIIWGIAYVVSPYTYLIIVTMSFGPYAAAFMLGFAVPFIRAFRDAGEKYQGKAAVVAVAAFVAFAWPVLLSLLGFGCPRNQTLDSAIVEKRIHVGMTLAEVSKELDLPPIIFYTCSTRYPDGRLVLEVTGSSPAFADLPDGYCSLELYFDKRGRVTGGHGTWYDGDNTDTDLLQLQQSDH